MGAGKYRDAVLVERMAAGGGRDRYGNLQPGDWVPLFSARGWLRQTSGKEKIAAGRLEDTATATLRIRASLTSPAWGITGADRVKVRSQIWAIKGAPIDPEGRGECVELLLERGGAVE